MLAQDSSIFFCSPYTRALTALRAPETGAGSSTSVAMISSRPGSASAMISRKRALTLPRNASHLSTMACMVPLSGARQGGSAILAGEASRLQLRPAAAGAAQHIARGLVPSFVPVLARVGEGIAEHASGPRAGGLSVLAGNLLGHAREQRLQLHRLCGQKPCLRAPRGRHHPFEAARHLLDGGAARLLLALGSCKASVLRKRRYTQTAQHGIPGGGGPPRRLNGQSGVEDLRHLGRERLPKLGVSLGHRRPLVTA